MAEQPFVAVEYWRCLKSGTGLVLFLLVSGHEDRSYEVSAELQLEGTPLGLALTTRTLLTESPASIEVDIDTAGLEPGRYDVVVSFDGHIVGTFPCEVGESEPVGA